MGEHNPLAGIKVMVIDDSNTIRRSAEIFLMQAGCQVILAENGFDALAKIADHQPDLIFVDIMMPRLDGYQTCALIKKSAKHRGTPVIMLSSKDGLFDRARGRMVGSDEYLTKPFTKESLLKAVSPPRQRSRLMPARRTDTHDETSTWRSRKSWSSTIRPPSAHSWRACSRSAATRSCVVDSGEDGDRARARPNCPTSSSWTW